MIAFTGQPVSRSNFPGQQKMLTGTSLFRFQTVLDNSQVRSPIFDPSYVAFFAYSLGNFVPGLTSKVTMTNYLLRTTTIKYSQKMIRTKQTTRAAFFALMSIALMVYSGCQPAAKVEPTDSNSASSSTSDSASSSVPEATASEPKPTPEAPSVAVPVTPTAPAPVAATPADPAPAAVVPAAVAPVAATPESEEPKSVGEPITIDGDLNSVDWKSMLGKEVTITGELVIVDTWDLARRGQVKVARNRLYVPTNSIDPNDKDPSATSYEGGNNVAKVAEAQKQNEKGIVILDDGLDDQNIFPPTLFPNFGKTHPTVRAGSTFNGVSGKLIKERNNIVLVPGKPVEWTLAQRPQRPDVGNAKVTVASFNVLNYFTTIDNGRNKARGADKKSEFVRQEAKIVSAILTLDADVVGLMEIENNLEAEIQLVAALNKEVGKDVYKACGLPDGFSSAPGGDNAIRVGIIYRSDRVEPVSDVAMINDPAFDEARTPIVQSFKSTSTDKPFTVIVNHFKSKGGSSRADVANKNKGDGQGAYNAKRLSQSLAICNFIEERKKVDAAPRVLVIGDLNAYGQEDPIDAMRAKGLVDLHEQFQKEDAAGNTKQHYSYIFRGQIGSLDHAFATDTLAANVTGIATWHINADEPRFLDYNQEYNPKSLFEVNPFRSSDHDPVLIGIGN